MGCAAHPRSGTWGTALGAVLVVLGALIAPAAAAAQERGTITGSVVDAETRTPIGAATVRVIGTSIGVDTRADGTFRLQIAPGEYQLRANAPGYAMAEQVVRVAAGQTATPLFTLRPSAVAMGELVVVGTRRLNRTAVDAPVPVDIVSEAEIELTGLTETSQILQRLAPSVNFPRATVADGTDHVRPATLRGLAPDQVLVLINGKRRHNSALVNVNGTVGRGATSVDLNAIPASSIERIEILRDGAAAQYGSDAIAGVINIVLKSGIRREAALSAGQTFEGDGEVLQVSSNLGFDLARSGFFNIGADIRTRGATNRSQPDARPQFFDDDPNFDASRLNIVNHRQGDAETSDIGAFINTAYEIRPNVELYGFGGLQYREGEAAGFFRRPLDNRTVRAIYPFGFLPLIGSEIWDGSGALGARGTLGGFRYDLSSVYGRNSFRFDVRNSANVSLGAESPTEFYAGTLDFDQFTTNLDLVRELELGMAEPVSVAFGAEYRRDGYGIEAGDEASYSNGGVPVLDGPNAGQIAPIGAQVFPGFRPSDAKDVSRSNVAGYVDVEITPIAPLLVEFAARAENYTDFGSTLDGKLAARYELTKGAAVRGAIGTGFRAPSLAQSFFSSTATNFIGGVPFDIRTFPAGSREAAVLGARPLQPEESVNYSAGIALDPTRALSLTVDVYRIDIDGRIVFSENFTGTRIQTLFQNAGFTGVTGGRFFTNAIDTRTQGVDVVLQYGRGVGPGYLRFVGGLNLTDTKVLTDSVQTPPQLEGLGETLFGRVERGRIERGQPRSNLNLGTTYTVGAFTSNLNLHRFGEVSVFGSVDPRLPGADTARSLDQTFDARWITDIDLSYRIADRFTLGAGANNVFDVYPEENFVRSGGPDNSNSGIFRYSGISPFGFNGAYYYLRLRYELPGGI